MAGGGPAWRLTVLGRVGLLPSLKIILGQASELVGHVCEAGAEGTPRTTGVAERFVVGGINDLSMASKPTRTLNRHRNEQKHSSSYSTSAPLSSCGLIHAHSHPQPPT